MIENFARYSKRYKVTDRRVLDAMSRVSREEFVPASRRQEAYADRPLPIGEGQTISQPFMVAFMTQELRLGPAARVLEIGTGSGYQAAVLAELAAEVYTIEIIEALGRGAEDRLRRLGCKNVSVRIGDGTRGWPEAAPFDAVIVTCAPERVPRALVGQLKPGGRLVIPIGPELDRRSREVQRLLTVRKTASGPAVERRMEVRFVPMTGEAGVRP